MRACCGLGLAVLVGAAPAAADDSSAALRAGGLELTRSADIRMTQERLQISPKAVSIRFVFVNETARDIDALVAFPMPDIDAGEFSESPLGTTSEDPVNFMNFKVLADGVRRPFQVEQKAFVNGRDVTAAVRAAGLPVNPVNQIGFKKLAALSPAQRKALQAAGVVEVEGPEDVHPLWTVRTRLYWRQRFAARRPVVLDQSYQPVTGQSLFGPSALSAPPGDGEDYPRKYCLDASTRAAASRRIKAALASDPRGGGYISAYVTDYVLKTGNNWKGPIGRFHLVLDKLSPDNLLSLCWRHPLTKTGPTTYESDLANFAPDQDIELLVLGAISR